MRRAVGFACLASVVLWGAACGGHPTRPSVIVVLVDTLRADYLSSYGFEGDISPNLDAIAAEAVQFESCFAQAPWTKPSVASLFTSLHPSVHGVTDQDGQFAGADGEAGGNALPEEAATLAEALSAAGYRTAAFVSNPWLHRNYGFAQGFDIYDDSGAGNTAPAEDLLVRVRQWLEYDDDDTPFFLYLHFMDVHGPYRSDASDYAALEGSPGLGPARALTASERNRIPEYLQDDGDGAAHGDATQLTAWRARYAAGVRRFDRVLGGFLAELRETDVLDRSVLVVTSDHGEEFVEHGGWDHGYKLYDHQIHVPLLVRNPGGANGGRRVSDVVSLVDLIPTLLTTAGAEHPEGLQGRDFSPLLRGETAPTASPSISSGVKLQPHRFAVRTDRYKLVADADGTIHGLFDLEADPAEQRDVSEGEAAVVADLLDRLGGHVDRMTARGPLDPSVAPLPDELRERLRSLGYVR